MIKKLIFSVELVLYFLLLINISFADIQKDLVNKITATKTLTFDFSQQIAEKKEYGNCFIKFNLFKSNWISTLWLPHSFQNNY